MLKVSKEMMVDAACQSDPFFSLSHPSTASQPDPMACAQDSRCTQDSGCRSDVGANRQDKVQQLDEGAAVPDSACRVLHSFETSDAAGQSDTWRIHSAITADSVRCAGLSAPRVDLDVVDVGSQLNSISGTGQDVGAGVNHQNMGASTGHEAVAGDGAAGADHDTVGDALDQGDALVDPVDQGDALVDAVPDEVEGGRGSNRTCIEPGSGEGADDNHQVDSTAVPDHSDAGDGHQDESVGDWDAAGAEARSPVQSAACDRNEGAGGVNAARAVTQHSAHFPIVNLAEASHERRETQERRETVPDAKEGAREAPERSQLRTRKARVQHEIEGMQQSRRETHQLQGQGRGQGQGQATSDGMRRPFLYNSDSGSTRSSAATRARVSTRRVEEDVRPGWHLWVLLACVVASPMVWTLLAGGGAADGAKSLVVALSSLSMLDCVAVSVSLAVGYAVGYSMVVSRASWKLFGLALGLLACTHLALNAAWDCAMLDLGMIERAGGAKAVAAGCLTVVSCLAGGYFVGYTATVWAGR